jgi:hypothetical protein
MEKSSRGLSFIALADEEAFSDGGSSQSDGGWEMGNLNRRQQR